MRRGNSNETRTSSSHSELSNGSFLRLADERHQQLHEFLTWAEHEEESGNSLRFDRRPDLERCERLLPLFSEPWWGVVVYTCFDSTNGTRAAAQQFSTPVAPARAHAALARVNFTRPSVQHHRTQVNLTRSKQSLLSACEKADDLKQVLTVPGLTFHERYKQLERIHVYCWGPTTNFDVLARSGFLKLDGEGYRPERAYLNRPSGTKQGFEYLWGMTVTDQSAEQCEGIVSEWSREWMAVASRLGVGWAGHPYDPADLENSLCIFNEHRRRRGKSLKAALGN